MLTIISRGVGPFGPFSEASIRPKALTLVFVVFVALFDANLLACTDEDALNLHVCVRYDKSLVSIVGLIVSSKD